MYKMGSIGVQGQFSVDCEYFAHCTPDGCIKIWDSASGCLQQEYTPSSHLSASSSCVAWGPSPRSSSPRRKKGKSMTGGIMSDLAKLKLIAMGTLTGDVLLYSVTKGDLHQHLHSGHTGVVNDVCWHVETDSIFTCSDDRHIVRWKISSGKVYEKWKADKEAVHSVCVVDAKNIISASSAIKWWDLEKKTVLKKFSGHGTEIFRLLPINQAMQSYTSRYFISAAAGDRSISAWCLKEDGDGSSVASFMLPDSPCSLSVTKSLVKDQSIRLSVITKNGNLHIFEHQLNGRCKTPLLPKVSIHIATSNKSCEKAQSVPVLAAQISSSGDLCQMAYGSFLKPVFESIELQDCEEDKATYLIRDVLLKHMPTVEKSVSLVKEVNKDDVVKRLAPGFMTPSQPTEVPHRKRKHRLPKEKELPMEERLSALYLKKVADDDRQIAKADSVIHLLLQGLQSQDHNLISTALQCSKEEIIWNSVKRLPFGSIPLLLKELHKRLNKREQRNHPCLRWMKVLLSRHLPYLMTCQDIDECLGPVSQLLEARAKLYGRILRIETGVNTLFEEVSSYQVESQSDPDPHALVTYVDDSSSEDEKKMNASECEEEEEEEEKDMEIASEEDSSEDESTSSSDSDDSAI